MDTTRKGWRDLLQSKFQRAFVSHVGFTITGMRFSAVQDAVTCLEKANVELGEPPGFDGGKCVDCGNRFRTEKDHIEPHHAFGPASTDNLRPRCYACHSAKTQRDRKAGKLGPRSSKPERATRRAKVERKPPRRETKHLAPRRRTKHAAPRRTKHATQRPTAERDPPGR